MACSLKKIHVGTERIIFRGACSCIITFWTVLVPCEHLINHNLIVAATLEMQLLLPHPFDKGKSTISK